MIKLEIGKIYRTYEGEVRKMVRMACHEDIDESYVGVLLNRLTTYDQEGIGLGNYYLPENGLRTIHRNYARSETHIECECDSDGLAIINANSLFLCLI